jgi:signal transduction histidine kinase
VLSALRAVESGGTIEVELQPGATGTIVLAVRDSGATRGEAAGLTPSREAIEQHGGALTVGPGRGGEGTVVLITLLSAPASDSSA